MKNRFRYLFLTIALAAAVVAAAQPVLPGRDYIAGEQVGMHLFLPSEFLPSLLEDRLQIARIRNLRAAYDKALSRGDYAGALSCADSLIAVAEGHTIQGAHFTQCYEKRARMLQALHRDAEACIAYDRALHVKELVMHVEQDQKLSEMQASYELDRLALDKALLTARHHKTAVIASALLLAAIAVVIGFIYRANRRTKRLQHELLLQRDQARHSEEKKNAFINSICHEVRTPLNSIAGFSELLSEEGLCGESRAQYCEIIQESRRQLRYLFNDILEVAYLENLREPLAHAYLDLSVLCRNQLRIMKVRFPKPGVVYAGEIPTGEIGVNSNEKYLRILLGALLNNAYKFTQQGSIRLACDREGDGQVMISVADTGCGIPRAQYDYVFERFTKLDPFSQGNGLGLYLCRLIVRHLGGTIAIDENWTEGTRIVVKLPRKPLGEGDKKRGAAGAVPLSKNHP